MKYYLFPFLFCFPLTMQAQTDEFRKQYDEFKRQAEQRYRDFRDEANSRYAEFLKKAWEEYKVLPAIPMPKDETMPPTVLPEEDKGKPIDSNPVPIEEVISPPSPEPQPVPVAPIHEQGGSEQEVQFLFYGTPCSVRYNEDLQFTTGGCSYEEIAKAWEALSGDRTNNTIRDCLELRIRLQLCDRAYLNMLDSFARKILGNTNEATLLMAYIYCQCGYKLRLAMDNNGKSLCLLFASRHIIYDIPGWKIDGEMFYAYNWMGDKLQVSEAGFPEEKPLSLFIDSTQKFAYNGSDARKLKSEYYPDIDISVSVNKNLIDFYNSYPTSMIGEDPMTRWAMYANTPMEKEVRESLYPTLRSHIGGLSEKEAVERLLNWVQTAFTYEYDDKVWGGDRAFFAEESLYYPYCDCEDRSILLTRIMRDLLGLDCILIYYSGHLACAVCFNEPVQGDYIQLNGKHYVVCDGTYIGAPVGMTMPDMENKTARVILLTND